MANSVVVQPTLESGETLALVEFPGQREEKEAVAPIETLTQITREQPSYLFVVPLTVVQT